MLYAFDIQKESIMCDILLYVYQISNILFLHIHSVIPNLRYGRVTVITLPINEDEDVL